MWITDLVNCLEASTPAHPLLDKVLAIKQQHLPTRIYKYRRDCPYHLDNLKTDTVRLSSPESVNDPYDCWFKVSPDLVARLLEKRLVNVFVTAYNLQNVIGEEQIENAKQSDEPLKAIITYIPESSGGAKVGPKKMAELGSASVKGVANNVVSTLQQFRKLTKLCSFSTVNDSMLMWSHYADNHRGFCLQYDLEALNADHPLRKNLYPVLYSSKLYDLTSFLEKLADPDPQRFGDMAPLLAVLRKFETWEYEQEWRMVKVTETVVDDRNFPVPAPSRIFLGSKLDTSTSVELLTIGKQKKIPIDQMRLADDGFKLLPEQFIE